MPTTFRYPAATASLCLLAWLVTPLSLSQSGMASEIVTARLRSGRVVVGAVDARTNSQQLWLRRASTNFDLVSGFAWQEIVDGQIADVNLDSLQLRDWAVDHKHPGRKFYDLPASAVDVPNAAVMDGLGPQACPQYAGGSNSDSLSASVNEKLRSIAVQAHLAHWDKDAQSDGLRIFVSTLGIDGYSVPIDGQIEFTLVVERELINGGQSYARRPDFVIRERRSQLVRRKDFIDGTAVYELNFSRFHPDFDPNVSLQGLLFARLSVPGQGVFEASDAQVFLREPSLFRDQLQYFTPGRYLPLESGRQRNH